MGLVGGRGRMCSGLCTALDGGRTRELVGRLWFFLGLSLGVVLAGSLISRIGSSAVIALDALVVAVLAVVFAWALRRRARLADIAN